LEATEPDFHNCSVRLVSDEIRHELEQAGLPFIAAHLPLIRLLIHPALREESGNPVRSFSVASGLPLPIDPAGPTPNECAAA
jgi:hypothetical protein